VLLQIFWLLFFAVTVHLSWASPPSNASYWKVESDFGKLGLHILSAPSREVGNDAEIVLSMDKPLVISYDFKNISKNVYLNEAIDEEKIEGSTWTMHINFPESGKYELGLSIMSKTATGTDYIPLARIPFTAKVARGANDIARAPNDTLILALKSHDISLMKSSLDKGADPNLKILDIYQYTRDQENTQVSAPVIFSVLRWQNDLDKQESAFRLLKERGADLKSVTNEGTPLLMELLRSSISNDKEAKPALLHCLLDLGADPNQSTPMLTMHDGKVVTEYGPILMEAAKYEGWVRDDFIRCLPLLIQYHARLDARAPSGESILEAAFQADPRGSDEIIRIYIDAGLDPDHDALWTMIKAYLNSKFNDDSGLLEIALSKSTHINDLDGDQRAIIHDVAASPASERRDRMIALLAAKGADFNSTDKNGWTPLMWAVLAYQIPDLKAIDDLLASRADPARKDPSGRTILYFINPGYNSESEKKDLSIFSACLDRFQSRGVDINSRDDNGETVFYHACAEGYRLDYLKLLIAKGANPRIPDFDGSTAYGRVKSMDEKSIVAYLASFDMPTYSGGYPTDNAFPACKAVLAGDLKALDSVSTTELQAKVARGSDGTPSTPLHLAVEAGDMRLIAALCAKQVNWNVGDRYGRTPLEYALREGKGEAIKALLAAGANPNKKDDWDMSPLSRAITEKSPQVADLINSGIKPEWDTIAGSLPWSWSLDQVKAYSTFSNWRPEDLDLCAALGRTDILSYLGTFAQTKEKSQTELINTARTAEKSFRDWEYQTKTKYEVRRTQTAWSDKPGNYLLTLPAWSPWMDVDPQLKLAQYPMAVYVPKGYDGSKPYGLVISMMNAESQSQFPKAEYLDSLDKRHLIYVGFDPYNGVFENGSSEFRFTNHERLCLAAAYLIFQSYAIDRNRVYLMGFSWGGRLTGEIVPKEPRVFTGGLAVGGCFITHDRIIPSYPYARQNAAMVLDTGDYDYNREETWNGYNTFVLMGYEAYFFQEPKKFHSRISGENFEKALAILDESAKRQILVK
jgi:ankyrin repeat protein